VIDSKTGYNMHRREEHRQEAPYKCIIINLQAQSGKVDAAIYVIF
jgi:hypothetical protein